MINSQKSNPKLQKGELVAVFPSTKQQFDSLTSQINSKNEQKY